MIINKRLVRSLLILPLIGAILAMSAPLGMVLGANGVTVSISAPDYTTPGSTFIATVNISEVTNFDSANYDVSFDSFILEVISITSGNIGATEIPVILWNETEPGRITVLENVPDVEGISGSGYLAEIQFHAIGAAGQSSEIALSNGVLSDNAAQEISATWTGDLVHITPHETATLSINTPETVYEGSNFSATVDISQVINFDACNYDVSFEPAVLQITGVTGGRIGETDIPVNLWNEIEPGKVTIAQNIPGVQGASGAGYLATLGFQVLGVDGQTSEITLSNIVLSDTMAQIIPAEWIGASIQVTIPVEPILSTVPYPPSHDFGEVPHAATREWSFSVANSGTGTLEWTVSDDQPWITVSPVQRCMRLVMRVCSR